MTAMSRAPMDSFLSIELIAHVLETGRLFASNSPVLMGISINSTGLASERKGEKAMPELI